MEWFQEFDSIFWLSFATLTFAFGGVVINGIFKSKCSKCKLCCIEVERDTAAEIEEQKIEIEHTPPEVMV